MAIADYGLHVCCDLHLFFSFQMNALLRTVLYRKVMLKMPVRRPLAASDFAEPPASSSVNAAAIAATAAGGGRADERAIETQAAGAILRFFSRSSVSSRDPPFHSRDAFSPPPGLPSPRISLPPLGSLPPRRRPCTAGLSLVTCSP